VTRLSDLVRSPEPLVPRSSLSEIFVEEPVPLDVFVQDKKYMYNPPLGDEQAEAVRHIERVYYPDLYPLMAQEFGSSYWAEPIRMVNFITLQWGKGSGKDHICRLASLRIAYLLQCLRDPQGYYAFPPQDTIHMLNVASSSSQANQAFFTPMTRAVKRGWFEDKCEPKPGLGLITWAKNVEMISGHADAESQEGMNLLLGLADEIDAFKTREEFLRTNRGREPLKSAEAILKMLRGSAVTRFPETFKNVRISYPRYQGSVIQRLTAEARADIEKRGLEGSRHYVSGPLPTWIVNPRYKGFKLIRAEGTDEPIPDVASIVEDYENNPAEAKGIYECKPSRAVDVYYKNEDAIRAAFGGDQPIEVAYTTTPLRSEVTGVTVLAWEPVYDFLSDFVPITGARYAMHGDLAVTGDRAGVAMSHVVRYEDVTEYAVDEEGAVVETQVQKPVIRNDFVITFEASAKEHPPREIQIRWARMLAFELVKRGFNVVSFTYDGFQSVDAMQILEQHGITAERLSMDRTEDPWKNLRDVLYEGRIEGPFSLLLVTELQALGRFGGKVDHPPGGSKDAADAFCGSVAGAVLAGGSEDPDGAVAHPGQDEIVLGYWGSEMTPTGDYPVGYDDALPVGGGSWDF
jgi:hypothetical protein